MNPPEGAAEEVGAADSDVDAFFRTGKVRQGSGAGGEDGRLGRGTSDKFGDGRLPPGRASRRRPPAVVGARVVEIHVVLAVLAAFWGGRGGWAPLGVHPSCGGLCWGGGRRSSWAAFSGRCWITLLRAASTSPCPGPSLCSPLPRCLSAGLLGLPRLVPFLPSRARGPDVLRGAAGVARRSGCSLTGRQEPGDVRSCRVRVGKQRLGLSTGLGGPWAPRTCSLVISPARRTDEFCLRIAYFWKCELASIPLNTHPPNICLPVARGA